MVGEACLNGFWMIRSTDFGGFPDDRDWLERVLPGTLLELQPQSLIWGSLRRSQNQSDVRILSLNGDILPKKAHTFPVSIFPSTH